MQCKFLHSVDYDLVYAVKCIFIANLRPTFSLRPLTTPENTFSHQHRPCSPIDLTVHQLTSPPTYLSTAGILQSLNSVVQGGHAMNKFCSFPRELLGVRSSKLRRSYWLDCGLAGSNLTGKYQSPFLFLFGVQLHLFCYFLFHVVHVSILMTLGFVIVDRRGSTVVGVVDAASEWGNHSIQQNGAD